MSEETKSLALSIFALAASIATLILTIINSRNKLHKL